MSKKTYHWILNDENGSSVMRYCHNCGKKVIFRDSQKRRRNANGKTIYEYAIYKCDRDHTWNVLMNTYKGESSMENNIPEKRIAKVGRCDSIGLAELNRAGISEIAIVLDEITGKWRIDKLLGDRIRDISRTKLCEFILQGRVLVDGKKVKQNTLLKKQQTITITLKS